MKSSFKSQVNRIMFLLFFAGINSFVCAQESHIVNGIILSREDFKPVPYANIVVVDTATQKNLTGTVSSFSGNYSIVFIDSKSTLLKISALGYKTSEVELYRHSMDLKLDTIFLEAKNYQIEETIVKARQIKAKSTHETTTFIMDTKSKRVASNGNEMLAQVPGVQVDLEHNISYVGSRNVVVEVNGIEHDSDFLQQVNPADIEKIEIINAPGSKYDAKTTSVINVIVKKQKDAGINGFVSADIPTSSSTVYSFPSYRVNYSKNKWLLYTAYQGEFSYFDIVGEKNRYINNGNNTLDVDIYEDLRQKNSSNQFSLGFDYEVSPKTFISTYAYFNEYSWEHDGTVQISSKNSEHAPLKILRDDDDENYASGGSIYLNHKGNTPGSELSVSLDFYQLKAQNTTYFSSPDTNMFSSSWQNSSAPRQKEVVAKVDYTLPLNDNIIFDFGTKGRFAKLSSSVNKTFNHHSRLIAGYGNANYVDKKFKAKLGFRLEHLNMVSKTRNLTWHFAPSLFMNYDLTQKQQLQASFKRFIHQPHFYQLNSDTSLADPYLIRTGNPGVKPQIINELKLTYNLRWNHHFLSTCLFYRNNKQNIGTLTTIHSTNTLIAETNNLGQMNYAGFEITGSLRPFQWLSINSYFKVHQLTTKVNALASEHLIIDKKDFGFASAFSAVASLKYDITASFQLQYNSPEVNMQNVWYSDPLYFFTINKTINNKLQVGFTCGLPFAQSVTYYGNEVNGNGFSMTDCGDIQLSKLPVWFKVKYTFSKGEQNKQPRRNVKKANGLPKKGF